MDSFDAGAQAFLVAKNILGERIELQLGGKETRKLIGRLKVRQIEGDEVSLCKVVSGKKEIKAALDAQQKILIISTD